MIEPTEPTDEGRPVNAVDVEPFFEKVQKDSEPSGLIACTYFPQAGICSTTQTYGTLLTLIATPSGSSQFGGWGGDCSSCSGLSCVITLDSDKSCTATMNILPLVQIDGPSYYASISTAYSNLTEGLTAAMQTRDVEIADNVDFDRNIQLTLQGGYNVGFSAKSGYTTLHGSIMVTRGSLVVDRLIVD